MGRRCFPGSNFGEFSNIHSYHYADRRLPGTVSLDFPFSNQWHELCICYQGNGWQMEKRYIEPATHLADETPWNLVEADFTKLSGECGFLSYSYFDASGQSISPPTGVFWERSAHQETKSRLSLESPRYFQAQVWVPTSRPLDDEAKQAVRELFVHCREKFREYFDSVDQRSQNLTTHRPIGSIQVRADRRSEVVQASKCIAQINA